MFPFHRIGLVAYLVEYRAAYRVDAVAAEAGRAGLPKGNAGKLEAAQSFMILFFLPPMKYCKIRQDAKPSLSSPMEWIMEAK